MSKDDSIRSTFRFKTAFRFRRSKRSSDEFAVRVNRRSIPGAWTLPDRADRAFAVSIALSSSVVSLASKIESVKDEITFLLSNQHGFVIERSASV